MDFLEQRKAGIGSSDIHHVFNLEPYGCRRRLWYDKRDEPPDYEDTLSSQPQILRGKRLEEVAAEVYSEETGRKLRRVGQKRHPEFTFLTANVDRTILGEDEGAGNLELKVPGQFMFRKIQAEGLPDAYALQIQHGLVVTRRSWASIGVFWADGWRLLRWDIKPDPTLAREIVRAGASFWREVENGPAPAKLKPDDKRCQKCPWRIKCQGEELRKLAELKPGEITEEAGDLVQLVEEFVEARDLCADAQELLDGRKARLKTALGDRVKVRAGGHQIVYRSFPVNRLDVTGFKAKHPDLAAKFTKQTWQRPLRAFAV